MPSSRSDLIAQAREWVAQAKGGTTGLIARLADALESAEAERDAALAAIEKALSVVRPGSSVPLGVSEARHWDRLLAESHRILSSVPADVLRERDAEKWDEGARHVYTEGGKCLFARDGDPCPYNPYRTEEEN